MNFDSCLNELTQFEGTPAEACAYYILLHLNRRHGSQWLSGPRTPMVTDGSGDLLGRLKKWNLALTEKTESRLSKLSTVRDLFAGYFFRGVVLDAHEGAVGWLEERYPLRLRFDIPSPDDMLEAQCEGYRFVTLFIRPEEQLQSYGRHADACDFLLHDLEHAHKFFGDPLSHRGQVQFFKVLRRSSFLLWMRDPSFVQDLDYLKSDMNSHPVHLMKYLKAVVLNAEIRRTGSKTPALDSFWLELFVEWHMPEHVQFAALKLNQPGVETEADQILVRDFFMETQDGKQNRAIVPDVSLSRQPEPSPSVQS